MPGPPGLKFSRMSSAAGLVGAVRPVVAGVADHDRDVRGLPRDPQRVDGRLAVPDDDLSRKIRGKEP